MSIPELNEFQVNVLMNTANGPSRLCAVIFPNDEDSPERREKLETQVKDMTQLLEWGLMKDISEQFEEQIKIAKVNHKRDSIVIMITEHAEKMFYDCGTRTIQ